MTHQNHYIVDMQCYLEFYNFLGNRPSPTFRGPPPWPLCTALIIRYLSKLDEWEAVPVGIHYYILL